MLHEENIKTLYQFLLSSKARTIPDYFVHSCPLACLTWVSCTQAKIFVHNIRITHSYLPHIHLERVDLIECLGNQGTVEVPGTLKRRMAYAIFVGLGIRSTYR
jgi:hypothetical protein